ncbi:MAG: pirin family protein [Tomitella sp.]|nr:pirin family protein [Tomitella sp.]
MPAITTDNPLALPRIREIADNGTGDETTLRSRPVLGVSTAPQGYEGEGFPVRRAFAGIDMRFLDPFIHMDQMGEVQYAPGEAKGTDWHPHRGFETVTYMIDGIMDHQDSNGGGGSITNGDTQWMTAGGGILHIEKPPEHLVASGGLLHGIQFWVNLPRDNKQAHPRYQDIGSNHITMLSSPDGGAVLRLIAGDLDGRTGPGSTFTPITLMHATIAPGAELRLPWNPSFNALSYVLAGDGSVGEDRHPVTAGQTAVFGGGDYLTVRAAETQDSRTDALEVFILGGRPIREPVAMYGPFVMNTKAEIISAFEDFQAGRLGTVPATHEEM